MLDLAVGLQPRAGRSRRPAAGPRDHAQGGAKGLDSLAYRIELWDEARERVELLLAATLQSSIGYATLYAAGKEYPNRYLTLSHKGEILFHWGDPPRADRRQAP